jgi:putative transposase
LPRKVRSRKRRSCWKKKYRGLGSVELHRLRQLEEENAQLKQIVADLTLDKQMLQDVKRKVLKVRQRRQPASMLVAEHRVSERRACATVFLHRSVYRYVDQPRDDRAVRQRLKEIAETRGALWLRTHSHPAAA